MLGRSENFDGTPLGDKDVVVVGRSDDCDGTPLAIEEGVVLGRSDDCDGIPLGNDDGIALGRNDGVVLGLCDGKSGLVLGDALSSMVGEEVGATTSKTSLLALSSTSSPNTVSNPSGNVSGPSSAFERVYNFSLTSLRKTSRLLIGRDESTSVVCSLRAIALLLNNGS